MRTLRRYRSIAVQTGDHILHAETTPRRRTARTHPTSRGRRCALNGKSQVATPIMIISVVLAAASACQLGIEVGSPGESLGQSITCETLREFPGRERHTRQRRARDRPKEIPESP